MITIAEIGLVLSGILLMIGAVEWVHENSHRKQQQYILDCAAWEMEQLQIRTERELEKKIEEEKIQKTKVFYLDFKITHGSAFGGFCSLMNDGRRKKGSVALDEILLYGKHPSGKEFTYRIEEQNIVICATDDPNELMVRSEGANFEIRQNGQGRDEGDCVQSAIIKKDTLYYIILESKHEISIKAVKGC